MNTWKVILATLVIFGAGIITGSLVMSRSDTVLRPHHKAASVEPPRHLGSTNASPSALGREVRVLAPNFLLKKDFLEKLDRELTLKTEQRERIEKIISEGQERLKCLCKSIDPEVQEELVETREKIRAELTPAQQALFAEFFKKKPAPARSGAATNSPPPIKAN